MEIDLDSVLQALDALNKLKQLSLEEKKKHWKTMTIQEAIITRKLADEKPPPNVEQYLKNLQKQVHEKRELLREALSKDLAPFSRALTDDEMNQAVNEKGTATTATTANTPDKHVTSPPMSPANKVTPEPHAPADANTGGAKFNEVGPPEIDPNEVEYNEQRDFLGSGSFGSVYSGVCRGQRVAVKVPNKQKLSDQEMEDFKNEVRVMKKIFHPHCVLFMGACTKQGQLKIITELMHTDCEKLLKSSRPLTLFRKLKMLKDAALGMNWLHGILHIIHHDLKPANLLVDENLNVKITDFGFSQLKDRDEATLESNGIARGTPLWMAPEILTGQPFNEKCDVYSFGLIIWQFFTRKEPFSQHSDFKKFRVAVCKKMERPTIPPECPNSLKSLMETCWQHEYDMRPPFKDILKELDNVMVDVAIEDPSGRDFWRTYFLKPKGELQETVKWIEFLPKLQTSLTSQVSNVTIHEEAMKKLKEVLAEKSHVDQTTSIVTIHRFHQVILWFGTFFNGNEHDAKNLEHIRQLVDKPWFHGEISKEVAEKRLAHRPEGTFLVRLSTTTPEFPFTVSLPNSQHRRIKRLGPQGYSFKDSKIVYTSLVQLIEECKDTQIATELKIPCQKGEVDLSYGYT